VLQQLPPGLIQTNEIFRLVISLILFICRRYGQRLLHGNVATMGTSNLPIPIDNVAHKQSAKIQHVEVESSIHKKDGAYLVSKIHSLNAY